MRWHQILKVCRKRGILRLFLAYHAATAALRNRKHLTDIERAELQHTRRVYLDTARRIRKMERNRLHRKMARKFTAEQKRLARNYKERLSNRLARLADCALRQEPRIGPGKRQYRDFKPQLQNHVRYPEQHKGTVQRCNFRLVMRAKDKLGNKCCFPDCAAPVESLEFHHRNHDGAKHRALNKSTKGQPGLLRHWFRIGCPTEEGEQFALTLACGKHHRMLDALGRKGNAA